MNALTTNDVAAILGVKPARVRELIKHRKLPAKNHPTAYTWIIQRAALKKYVQEGRAGRGRPRTVDLAARRKACSNT